MFAKIPLVARHLKGTAKNFVPSGISTSASSSTLKLNQHPCSIAVTTSTRGFITISDTPDEAPNPLADLRNMSQASSLCDENGCRLPDKHWAFFIAANEDFSEKAPNLRTVNFQRITNEGIDFISKTKPSSIFSDKKPVSFLYTIGQYVPGQVVFQWRANGFCEKIDLGEILSRVPEYSITEIVASVRARKERNSWSEPHQPLEGRKSHFTEIVQQTREDLANSNISQQEVHNCIQAWRFVPQNMERMKGGPDQIMWDRWEFTRDERTSNWREPTQLLPY